MAWMESSSSYGAKKGRSRQFNQLREIDACFISTRFKKLCSWGSIECLIHNIVGELKDKRSCTPFLLSFKQYDIDSERMDRNVSRYAARHCYLQCASREMPAVFRASFATVLNRKLAARSVGKISRRKSKGQLPKPNQHSPSGAFSVYESLQPTRLALLGFRKDTDTIGQTLRISPDGLRTWVEDFLQLGRLKLVEDRDSGEVCCNLRLI